MIPNNELLTTFQNKERKIRHYPLSLANRQHHATPNRDLGLSQSSIFERLRIESASRALQHLSRRVKQRWGKTGNAITRGFNPLVADQWEHVLDFRGGSGLSTRGLHFLVPDSPPHPGPGPSSRRPTCTSLTFGVQSAAAAGPPRPQESGQLHRPRAHAQQPKGPGARPRRGLQQRQGGRGGADASDSGAQDAGHAAQQRQHFCSGGRGGGGHVRIRKTTLGKSDDSSPLRPLDLGPPPEVPPPPREVLPRRRFAD